MRFALQNANGILLPSLSRDESCIAPGTLPQKRLTESK
jgi:hypothetical protein